MAPKRTFPCPICDGDVPLKAKACPHCGACDKTGWNEAATSLDGLDLPDDKFDYERFIDEEFRPSRKPKGRNKLIWKVTAVVLFGALLLLIFFNSLFQN